MAFILRSLVYLTRFPRTTPRQKETPSSVLYPPEAKVRVTLTRLELATLE